MQGVVAASTAAGVVAATGASAAGGAMTPPPAAPLEVLTPEQGRLLAMALNRIIPADDTMPAAGDAGMTAYVDQVLSDAPHLKPPVVGLLNELHRDGFMHLSEAQQDARLRQLAADRPESFETLLHAAYTGYYSDPWVLQAAGCVLADSARPQPFDETLLNPVRKRGPVYRRDGGPEPVA